MASEFNRILILLSSGKSFVKAFEDAGGNNGPTYFQPSRRAANSSRRLLAMATYFIVLPIEQFLQRGDRSRSIVFGAP